MGRTRLVIHDVFAALFFGAWSSDTRGHLRPGEWPTVSPRTRGETVLVSAARGRRSMVSDQPYGVAEPAIGVDSSNIQSAGARNAANVTAGSCPSLRTSPTTNGSQTNDSPGPRVKSVLAGATSGP